MPVLYALLVSSACVIPPQADRARESLPGPLATPPWTFEAVPSFAASLDEAGAVRPPFALATGSATSLVRRDGGEVWVASPDEEAVFVVGSGAVERITLDARPSHLTAVPGRVLVTLPSHRAIGVLDAGDPGAGLVEAVEVGTEPRGIVATGDGTRVYVALATQRAVVELDGATLATRRVWAVEGEPTWLALRPQGDALYVGSAVGQDAAWIDVASAEARVRAIPLATRAGSKSSTPRMTGDPTVSPDGRSLVLPVLYVDAAGEVLPPGTEPDERVEGRVSPALAWYDLGEDGTPGPEGRTVLVGVPDPRLGEGDELSLVMSYFGAALFRADGEAVYAAMEGSATVVLVGEPPAAPDVYAVEGASILLGDDESLAPVPVAAAGTAEGPGGLARDNAGDLYLQAWLDGRVERIDGAAFADALAGSVETHAPRTGSPATAVAGLPADALPADEHQGRRLFYTAIDPSVSAPGTGYSCATCHFQRRTDGLVWLVADGQRNTPSLAVALAETGPYTWKGAVVTVAGEAMATSANRIGGTGLDEKSAQEIAAYLAGQAPPDLPTAHLDHEAVARGADLFDAVGCADCHSGPNYTNRERTTVAAVTFDTPTLRGVSLTAPYFHAGSLPTLRSVIDEAESGRMGAPFSATDDEKADLEAFLRSL